MGGGKSIPPKAVTPPTPIKGADKELVVSTAIAGELLGMKMIYLEAGSGTIKSLEPVLLKEVRKNISAPIIAGGGIDSAEKAFALCKAGADMVVVGNAIEKNSALVPQICKVIRSYK